MFKWLFNCSYMGFCYWKWHFTCSRSNTCFSMILTLYLFKWHFHLFRRGCLLLKGVFYLFKIWCMLVNDINHFTCSNCYCTCSDVSFCCWKWHFTCSRSDAFSSITITTCWNGLFLVQITYSSDSHIIKSSTYVKEENKDDTKLHSLVKALMLISYISINFNIQQNQ